MSLGNKQYRSAIKNGIVTLLGIALVYWLVSVSVDKRFTQIEAGLRERLESQQKTLVSLSETTARNGADTVTAAIIKDCSLAQRDEFDTLLSRLDAGLSHEQLITLDRLFGRCGDYYAEVKAVMASRLANEIEGYGKSVQQLEIVLNQDLQEEYAVDVWQALAELEKKQSGVSLELVAKQDQIITMLLSGKTVSSPEMKETLRQVKEQQETLMVTSEQASQLRAKLSS